MKWWYQRRGRMTFPGDLQVGPGSSLDSELQGSRIPLEHQQTQMHSVSLKPIQTQQNRNEMS